MATFRRNNHRRTAKTNVNMSGSIRRVISQQVHRIRERNNHTNIQLQRPSNPQDSVMPDIMELTTFRPDRDLHPMIDATHSFLSSNGSRYNLLILFDLPS